MHFLCVLGCHRWHEGRCSRCQKVRQATRRSHDDVKREPSLDGQDACADEAQGAAAPGTDRSASPPPETMSEADAGRLLSDAPIFHTDDDRLGRAAFAQSLAEALVSVRSQDGFVFAINGEWGSGKTSILNLVAAAVEDGARSLPQQVAVIHFNPWWLSADDDLLLRMLDTMSGAIGRLDRSARLDRLGQALSRLGAALSPLRYVPAMGAVPAAASDALATAATATRSWADALTKDVAGIRDDVVRLLAEGDTRLLVVMDDIDRLTPQEVASLFRVIKAVGSFPHTTYLLAFDRCVVAEALGSHLGVDGDAYVGKVVQASVRLPLPDPADIQQMLTAHLDEFVHDWAPDNWEPERWANIYAKGVRHLVRTPRDVKRYANALNLTCGSHLRSELNPVDALGVEALRVFAPASYDLVRDNPGVFLGSTGQYRLNERDGETERCEGIVAHAVTAAPDWAQPHVESVLRELFPNLPRRGGGAAYGADWHAAWRRSRRVCVAEVFPVYFQLAVPHSGASRSLLKSLIALAGSPDLLAQELRRIAALDAPAGRRRVSIVLQRLEDHTEEDIPSDHVLGFLDGLFRVADELVVSDPPARGVLEWGIATTIMRLTYQLCRRLQYAERYQFLAGAVASSPSPSTAVHEVAIAEQHWEGADKGRPVGEAMVERADLGALKQIAVERIAAAAADQTLLTWANLGAVLYRWRDWNSPEAVGEWLAQTTSTDAGLCELLAAVLHTGSVETAGSYYSRTTWHSARDLIEELCPTAQVLADRVAALLEGLPRDAPSLQRRALEAYLSDRQQRE